MVVVWPEWIGKLVALLPPVHDYCSRADVCECLDCSVNTDLVYRRAGCYDVGNAKW